MPEAIAPDYECRHCRKPLLRPARSQWSAVEGQPFPLGVKWLPAEQAYNFAVYSMHEQSVELLLFRKNELDRPASVFSFDRLRNKSGIAWHCRIPVSATNGAGFYAYRFCGPESETGDARNAFDSDKLLLDPYARSGFFPTDFDRSAAQRPGSNLGKAPLGLLVECECEFEWNGDSRVRHEADLIIYEMHIRGFTRHQSSWLPVEQRGTFDGVIAKIPYLIELGVTAVELMPVFQFDPQEGNYWGHMPLSFFAPHPVDMSPSSHSLAFSLSGSSAGEGDLYILINGSHRPPMFRVQRGSPGEWRKVIDTAAESPRDISRSCFDGDAVLDTLEIAPHSIAVLGQT